VPVEEAQHRYIVPEKFKNFRLLLGDLRSAQRLRTFTRSGRSANEARADVRLEPQGARLISCSADCLWKILERAILVRNGIRTVPRLLPAFCS
jgi:hypothetical protein